MTLRKPAVEKTQSTTYVAIVATTNAPAITLTGILVFVIVKDDLELASEGVGDRAQRATLGT